MLKREPRRAGGVAAGDAADASQRGAKKEGEAPTVCPRGHSPTGERAYLSSSRRPRVCVSIYILRLVKKNNNNKCPFPVLPSSGEPTATYLLNILPWNGCFRRHTTGWSQGGPGVGMGRGGRGRGGGREGRGGVQVNMREAGESRWTEARAAPHESRESFVRPAGGHGETERLTVLGRFPTF